MRFRIEQRFGVPIDRVEAALCDPRFMERMAALPKVGRPQLLDQEVDGDVIHRRVRYAFSGDLSAAVRRVVDPARLTWVEESTIDRRSHVTTFRILPDNYAALLRCDGSFRLSACEDHGTLRTAEGQVVVTVPLVGGKVERAIVSGLEEHAREEVPLVEDWVAAS